MFEKIKEAIAAFLYAGFWIAVVALLVIMSAMHILASLGWRW